LKALRNQFPPSGEALGPSALGLLPQGMQVPASFSSKGLFLGRGLICSFLDLLRGPLTPYCKYFQYC